VKNAIEPTDPSVRDDWRLKTRPLTESASTLKVGEEDPLVKQASSSQFSVGSAASLVKRCRLRPIALDNALQDDATERPKKRLAARAKNVPRQPLRRSVCFAQSRAA